MNQIGNMVAASPDDGHASRVTGTVGWPPRDHKMGCIFRVSAKS
jgi:hypothetical protein